MGVPGFFLWLIKNYKKEGFVFQKEKLSLISKDFLKNESNQNMLDKINSIDYFLIDANCLIHPVCFKIIADNPDLKDKDKLESKMMTAVLEYLDKLISYVDPKSGIYLAIDGVAPVAKIKQQRSRRFKSVSDKKMFDTIKTKHSKEIGNYWNNSAITPGTVFMEKLHNKILDWSKNSGRHIIYSSCFTPAEGEHKLLQFIRTNQNNNLDFSYVIYGLDADLIFLALSTESDKIYLLREANEINKKESKEVLNYVSISIMRESIVSTIKNYIDKIDNSKLFGFLDKINESRIVNDFIFMCYFLGNDFLPHIPSLDIHKDGIENLITKYIETMSELILENNKVEYLLNSNKALQGKTLKKVNEKYLHKFIKKLGSQEDEILKDNFTKGKRRMICDGDAYQKELFKIENLQFKISDPIQLGSDSPDRWRLRYYQHYWGVDEEDLEKFSQQLVNHYMIGIKWVTQYYFDKCPSWDWYYPFDQPPFISDIAKYIETVKINKIKFTEGKPLKQYMQLLCVLPHQSSYLLPNSFVKLMTNSKSSLAFMYPIEFEQDFINKKKYWMAVPKLPPLDIELVKKSYFKYKNELKDDDIKRNKYLDIFEFKV